MRRNASRSRGNVCLRMISARKEQRGEGIDLNFREAVALAGDRYRWFVAKTSLIFSRKFDGILSGRIPQ
jgi:hypothetical protein